ncbi:efflux RND transporter periplasmic adaptor subunit [soil metagenome]
MKQPNTWSTRRVIGTSVLTLAVLATIGVAGHERSAEAQQPAAAPPAPQVSVATVVSRDVTLYDDFSGRVEPIERVEIRPRVSGTIDRVHFADGQLVKKGDALFTIDPRPYAAEVERAEANLLGDRARAALAETQKARAGRLLDEKAISQREFDERDQGLSAARAAEAQSSAALRAARLNLEYTRIVAPVTGRVSRAEITTGNLVSPGSQVLTTIVSVSPIYVAFDVDERTYQRYSAGGTRGNQGVTSIPVRMGLLSETDAPRTGHVSAVDNRLDPSSGTIRARAVFDNADGQLVPGMLAKVQLGGQGKAQALLINDRAVGTDQARKFVLVVGEGNKLEYREVQLGALSDGLRVINSGLKANERIVVGGLQRVRPGVTINPQQVDMDAKVELTNARAAEKAKLAQNQ